MSNTSAYPEEKNERRIRIMNAKLLYLDSTMRRPYAG